MNFEYIYSLEDFLNNKVNEEALIYEIATSEITKALDYIIIDNETECHIFFKAELSEDEQAILDAIVANHTGEAIGQTKQTGFDRMQLLGSDAKAVDIDSDGRLQVLAVVMPKEHELSGPQHLGQLSNDQIPDYIVRDSDLTVLSGTLHQEIVNFSDNYYNKVEVDGLLADKAQLTHDHDLRYYKKLEIDSMLVTTHSGLAGLNSDDHLQYLTNERGDARYYLKDQIDTISGTLQLDINTKADVNHQHDDRYYTEEETNLLLIQKADSNHIHSHESLSDLTNDDHPQYLLVSGLRPVEGDLIVHGNLLVSGTQFVSQTETVVTSDNVLLLNNGESGPGVSAGVAGIEIDRGTQENYRFLFSEHAHTFIVGISGSERPVVVRSIHDDFDINYVPYFIKNNVNGLVFYELTTSGSLNINDVASVAYVESISNMLQTSINNKADIKHTHNESEIVDLEHSAVKIRDKMVQTPTIEDDGKRLVYRADSDSFILEETGYGGGGVSFPFSYFYHTADLKKSSTTDYYKWHNKLKLTVDVPEGKYRVGWNYQWALFNNNKEFMARVRIDNEEIMYHAQRPKYYRDTYYNSGFRYVDLDEGEHTIYLDYKPERRVTAVIWNVELEFWRINVK